MIVFACSDLQIITVDGERRRRLRHGEGVVARLPGAIKSVRFFWHLLATSLQDILRSGRFRGIGAFATTLIHHVAFCEFFVIFEIIAVAYVHE